MKRVQSNGMGLVRAFGKFMVAPGKKRECFTLIEPSCGSCL